MLDTKGPEIRTVKLVDGNDVKLVAGQEFTLLNDPTVIGDQVRPPFCGGHECASAKGRRA